MVFDKVTICENILHDEVDISTAVQYAKSLCNGTLAA